MSIPKPAERRQRRNKRDIVALDSVPLPVPRPPTGLLKASVIAWERLWGSPLARTFNPDSDLPSIERLFTLRDERARSFRAARRNRVVAGSQEQAVLSPLLGYVAKLDAEIRQLEDRFGLTPRARLQLGVTLGEAHRSLDALNAAFMEEATDDEDPRLV